MFEPKVGEKIKYLGVMYEAHTGASTNNEVCVGCSFDNSVHCFKLSARVDCTEHDVIFKEST